MRRTGISRSDQRKCGHSGRPVWTLRKVDCTYQTGLRPKPPRSLWRPLALPSGRRRDLLRVGLTRRLRSLSGQLTQGIGPIFPTPFWRRLRSRKRERRRGETRFGGGASPQSSTHDQMVFGGVAGRADRYRWLTKGGASGRVSARRRPSDIGPLRVIFNWDEASQPQVPPCRLCP